MFPLSPFNFKALCVVMKTSTLDHRVVLQLWPVAAHLIFEGVERRRLNLKETRSAKQASSEVREGETYRSGSGMSSSTGRNASDQCNEHEISPPVVSQVSPLEANNKMPVVLFNLEPLPWVHIPILSNWMLIPSHRSFRSMCSPQPPLTPELAMSPD